MVDHGQGFNLKPALTRRSTLALYPQGTPDSYQVPLHQQWLIEVDPENLSKILKGNIWSEYVVLLQRPTEAWALGHFLRNILLLVSLSLKAEHAQEQNSHVKLKRQLHNGSADIWFTGWNAKTFISYDSHCWWFKIQPQKKQTQLFSKSLPEICKTFSVIIIL